MLLNVHLKSSDGNNPPPPPQWKFCSYGAGHIHTQFYPWLHFCIIIIFDIMIYLIYLIILIIFIGLIPVVQKMDSVYCCISISLRGTLPSPCSAFSQSLSVNSLRWLIRGERAGNTFSHGPHDPKRFGREEKWGLGTRQRETIALSTK